MQKRLIWLRRRFKSRGLGFFVDKQENVRMLLKKGFTIDKFLQVNLHQLDRLRQLIQISSEASVDVLTKMDMYSKARVPNI